MISIPSTVKISLRALRVNKMRSALTMLGIIIGVGAVITMIAVGKGTSEQVSKQIATVGSNMIIVLPGSTTAGGVRGGMGTQMTLTRDDAEAIERECSAVLYAAPILSGVAQIVYGNQNWATSVQGTATNILAVRDLSLTAGRNFTDQDIRNSTKVCILGQTVVNMLFGGMEPINQTVRIKKVPFMVIGVLESKGQSVIGRDQDDVIYIPLTTAQKRIFGTTFPGMVHTIAVKARSAEDLSRAEEQITQLLRQRHRIGPKQEDDFSVRNLTQMLELAQQAAKAMALLLAAIASISLLVG
ncbi:MAG: ABC transporter permease, partial [Deltaproteobacteria bacterium]|nr:ABC transporter permease [Deltaproteobacteria bacterium]